MPGEFLRFSEPNLTLRPVLATSWKPSQGGKRWTFQLRRGVKFRRRDDDRRRRRRDVQAPHRPVERVAGEVGVPGRPHARGRPQERRLRGQVRPRGADAASRTSRARRRTRRSSCRRTTRRHVREDAAGHGRVQAAAYRRACSAKYVRNPNWWGGHGAARRHRRHVLRRGPGHDRRAPRRPGRPHRADPVRDGPRALQQPEHADLQRARRDTPPDPDARRPRPVQGQARPPGDRAHPEPAADHPDALQTSPTSATTRRSRRSTRRPTRPCRSATRTCARRDS